MQKGLSICNLKELFCLKDFIRTEAVSQKCAVKKVFLEILQNSQENTCEFCEISKNTYFNRTPLVVASVSKISFEISLL